MRATCCPATAREMYSKGVPPTILYEYQNKELTKSAFLQAFDSEQVAFGVAKLTQKNARAGKTNLFRKCAEMSRSLA